MRIKDEANATETKHATTYLVTYLNLRIDDMETVEVSCFSAEEAEAIVKEKKELIDVYSVITSNGKGGDYEKRKEGISC